MRAGVLVAAALVGGAAASQVKLVSQSATGPLTGTSGATLPIPWVGKMNATMSGVLSLNMDVDTGSFRVDVNFTSSDHPSKTMEDAILFSGKTKRMYQKDGSDCQFIELPNIPEPSKYIACAEGLLEHGKKFFKNMYVVKDDMPDKKLGPVTIGGSGALVFSINTDGSITKLDLAGSARLLGVPLFVFGGEWHPTASSLGSPDASVFDVPAEWGECKEHKIDNSAQLDKVQQAWLKCVKPELVLSDGLVVV